MEASKFEVGEQVIISKLGVERGLHHIYPKGVVFEIEAIRRDYGVLNGTGHVLQDIIMLKDPPCNPNVHQWRWAPHFERVNGPW